MLSSLFGGMSERTEKMAEEMTEKVIEAIERAREEDRPDNLLKILEYIPEYFDDKSEEDYIQAVASALVTSFDNGLYQFAYIQEHMLFMTAVYFVLLKIYRLHKDETEKALFYLLKDRKGEFFSPSNTKNGDLFFGSFAAINESDVFMLLKVADIDESLMNDLKKLVKERNEYAHANGRLMLTSDELFVDKINDYAEKVDKVYLLVRKDIEKLYFDTITSQDFYDPEIRSYDDPDEQIVEEFVKSNFLSRAEVNWLRKIKTKKFETYPGFEHIKDLHIALCHYYNMLVQDNENYHAIEDEYYHYKYANRANEFVENELGISAYVCTKDGGEFPVYDCPDCGEDQLAYDVESGKAHCFACETDFNSGELSFCAGCGSIMRCNEINMCDNCIDYKMKDD